MYMIVVYLQYTTDNLVDSFMDIITTHPLGMLGCTGLIHKINQFNSDIHYSTYRKTGWIGTVLTL